MNKTRAISFDFNSTEVQNLINKTLDINSNELREAIAKIKKAVIHDSTNKWVAIGSVCLVSVLATMICMMLCLRRI